MDLDVLILVPFEDPVPSTLTDPTMRRSTGAHFAMPIVKAVAELEEFIGQSLRLINSDGETVIGGEPVGTYAKRSISAVTLVSAAERAGLSWEAIDPGLKGLDYWRKTLSRWREKRPRCVALCTTFILSTEFLKTLVSIIRQALPDAKLLVGGYYYATNAKQFLTLDADVMCIGEGEVRFPQIVQTIRDGSSLEGIPGLYIRHGDGSLVFTGHAEPLVLDELEPPNWDLAPRIEPQLRADQPLQYGFETQRGCVFKCQFCTYRTLALPNIMSPEKAIERIFAMTSRKPHGSKSYMLLLDATATYPLDRFETLMKLAIQRGGFPCPIEIYARVNDITEHNAELMAKAGVARIFVGQESGDQRILTAMKKGTHVSRVRPAMAALAKWDISVLMSFIYGFPGETRETIQNTRNLITSLNVGLEDRLPVLLVDVYPFFNQDLSAVKHEHTSLQDAGEFGYQGTFDAKLASEEVLATVMAVSRVPSAPVFSMFLEMAGIRPEVLPLLKSRYKIHRWVKAMERGISIFLEADLDGKRPNLAELRRVASELRSSLPSLSPIERLKMGGITRGKAAFARTLYKQIRAEEERGIGWATRLIVGAMAYNDLGRVDAAVEGIRKGGYPTPAPSRHVDTQAGEANVTKLASSLITHSVEAPLRFMKEGKFQQRVREARKLPIVDPTTS